MEELKQILSDFKWTFENMGTPHTPDHFNIPANAITQLEKIIAASPPSMPSDYEINRVSKKNRDNIFTQMGFVSGAEWMRSQCDGLIKQKAVRFKEWCEEHEYEVDNHAQRRHTTEELYEIFNQQDR